MKKYNLFSAVIFSIMLLGGQCQDGIKFATIKTGAERTELYLPQILDKKVGLVANHSSTIGHTHLADSLIALGVNVAVIFSPEHGFKGDASDGAWIPDGMDEKSRVPIISLYGKNKKPDLKLIEELDLVIFDIQDVGVRCYTYLFTMTYVMESCAETRTKFMVLDRPNPNGHFVDGPVLDPDYRSGIGLHAVPVVHGMTVGEYALMINEEGFLKNGDKCDLQVIPCLGYDHKTFYSLPLKPSPNLPNMRSIYLYPSLCFFEGTVVSVGRGTDKQFQVLGCPQCTSETDFYFTPVSSPGSKYPPQENKKCYGIDLTVLEVEDLQKVSLLNLDYLISFYNKYPDKETFFLPTLYFDKLAGSDQLRKQLESGMSEREIRASWVPGLNKFNSIREKYLLYD